MTAVRDMVRPTEEIAQEAKTALRTLVPPRRKRPRRLEIGFAGEHDAVSVPLEVGDLVVRILAELANGNAVTVLPVTQELTTQQAADMLNVSRPYFITLLETGKIPYRKVGTRRRVLCADVLAYKQREMADARKAVADLTGEAQKLGLGY